MNTNLEIMPESPFTAKCGAAIPAVDTLGLIYVEGQEMEIPEGYCQCGCGKKTSIWKCNEPSRGRIKGQAAKYVHSHNPRNKGINHHHWNNGRTTNHGYVLIKKPDHPRANQRGYVSEHILICEKALGKPLPPKAEPHHVDNNRANNANTNLVLCQDHAYHQLIARRTRAYKACGHASWLKCWICKKWDDPKNLYLRKDGRKGHHKSCYNERYPNHRKQALEGEGR